MTPADAQLKDWALIYVRHRDINFRKISEIKDTGFGFSIINNDGKTMNCLVFLSLESLNPDAAEISDNAAILVTYNNDKNVQMVNKLWDKLASKKDLLIVFANPLSEEKWILKPNLHDKICDRKSLLLGLRAMAELVAPISGLQ